MNKRIRKKKDKKIMCAEASLNGLISIAERQERQRQAAIQQFVNGVKPCMRKPPSKKCRKSWGKNF